MSYDPKLVYLVYLALILVVVVIAISAGVIKTTPETNDPEARKVRFAAATFTGITMLFLFISTLYFASGKDGAGKEIFDRAFSAMFTLAGTIVGYIFGSAKGKAKETVDEQK
jgi:hypothetical protein